MASEARKKQQAVYRAIHRESLRTKAAMRRLASTAADKAASKKYDAAYHIANANTIKKKRAAYRAANKDKVRQQRALYSALSKGEKKAYSAAYRVANKDALRAKKAAYNAANKAKTRKRNLAYRAANKEALKKKRAAWLLTPKGIAAIRRGNAKRRAIEASATIGDLQLITAWEKTWRTANLVACHWCGKKFPGNTCHGDHVISLAKGGAHDVANLCVACPTCNFKKYDKRPEVFNATLEQPLLFW